MLTLLLWPVTALICCLHVSWRKNSNNGHSERVVGVVRRDPDSLGHALGQDFQGVVAQDFLFKPDRDIFWSLEKYFNLRIKVRNVCIDGLNWESWGIRGGKYFAIWVILSEVKCGFWLKTPLQVHLCSAQSILALKTLTNHIRATQILPEQVYHQAYMPIDKKMNMEPWSLHRLANKEKAPSGNYKGETLQTWKHVPSLE